MNKGLLNPTQRCFYRFVPKLCSSLPEANLKKKKKFYTKPDTKKKKKKKKKLF